MSLCTCGEWDICENCARVELGATREALRAEERVVSPAFRAAAVRPAPAGRRQKRTPGTARTLQETADALGLSVSGVQKLEQSGLRKIRANTEFKEHLQDAVRRRDLMQNRKSRPGLDW